MGHFFFLFVPVCAETILGSVGPSPSTGLVGCCLACTTATAKHKSTDSNRVSKTLESNVVLVKAILDEMNIYFIPFSSVVFSSPLFYSSLFHSILFYSILFYSILFFL